MTRKEEYGLTTGLTQAIPTTGTFKPMAVKIPYALIFKEIYCLNGVPFPRTSSQGVYYGNSKNGRSQHSNKIGSLGLLANGVSAPWEIAIDGTTAGADRWFAQLEGPSISFYFEIPSLDIVGKMARFLEPRSLSTNSSGINVPELNSLVLGKEKKNPVTLVRDDEYEDRFFLLVGPTAHPIVRFVVAGSDAVQMAKALRQVEEDLNDEA